MRAYSLPELKNLTRNQLFALHAEIVAELASLPETSADATIAQANLQLIRSAISCIYLQPL